MEETTIANLSNSEQRIVQMIRDLKEYETLEVKIVGKELQVIFRQTVKESFPVASMR